MFQDKVKSLLIMYDGYISMDQILNLIQMFKGQSLFEGVQTSENLEKVVEHQSESKKVLMKRVVF